MTISHDLSVYIGDLWLMSSFGFLMLVILMLLISSIKREQIIRRLEVHMAGQHANRPRNLSVGMVFEGVIDNLKFLIPGNAKEREEAESRLRYAGYRDEGALTIYYLIRTTGLVVLPAMVYFGTKSLGTLPEMKIMIYTLLSVGVGLVGPSYFLDKKVEARQLLLRNQLPDALDLLVVCSESGLGLNAGLVRVVKELHQVHPELAKELAKVNSEIQGGLDRESALNNLIERTGIDELRALVLVINQTMKLGTSVADTLRIYSDEYRDARMQAAEAKAAQISTKMIFPLVFCFLPCFFIVSIGPSAIKLLGAMG